MSWAPQRSAVALFLLVTSSCTAFQPLRAVQQQQRGWRISLSASSDSSSFVVDVVERAAPSLCCVRSEGPRGMNATGTGMFFDAGWLSGAESGALWVLTNAHVVPPSKGYEVIVDKVVLAAQLVGRSKTADLALLRVDGSKAPPRATRPALIAVEEAEQIRAEDEASKARGEVERGPLMLGEHAVALGFASQGDQDTGLLVTRGIVSGLATKRGVPYVLTDAALKGGMSGGPLLDEQGACVGVCTYDQQGVGHAIAIHRALEEMRAIHSEWQQRTEALATNNVEHAVYLFNDQFNKRARVAEVLAEVFGADEAAADAWMSMAHKTGRAECAVCDDADEAAKFVTQMIKADLIAEVETRVKEAGGEAR